MISSALRLGPSRRPGPGGLSLAALASVVLVLVALVAAAPADAQRSLTLEDVARIQEVDSVALSPDGATVAYTLQVPRIPFEEEDGEARRHLWMVGADEGGAARPFVTGDIRVGEVAWTPDGSAVSFLAKRGDDEDAVTALHLIPRDGGEATAAITHATSIGAYAWNGDGSAVAFLAEEETPEADETLEEQGFDALVYEEELEATRVWVSERGDDGAWGAPRMLALEGHAVDLTWCPGGDRLAVSVARSPLVDDELMFTRVRVVDPSDGSVVRALDNPGKLGDVAWSPDCSRLAFIGGSTINDPAEGRLMVASVADGTMIDALPDYPGHVRDLVWHDDASILIIGDEGTRTTVKRVAADGSTVTTLAAAGETIWAGPSLSAAGNRIAMTGESATHPGEAFVGSLDSRALVPRRLSDSNPWLADVALAPQEVITYEARDGLEIEGILIRPLERAEGARVPLIMVVHGGPEAHIRNGWVTGYSRPGQVAAGQGYAVFYPNYRGSTGRGVEFTLTSQGRPAKEEFDDLVDGVDHLVETGLVDRERVGITGGSYGGYASAWGATYYSERFAASVMFVGISNKISKLGTSDIPEELYLVHENRRLWEDFQHFLEASPIYYVERAQTPILILHGDSDTRVHPSQSMELYRALKTKGDVPVRLVFYPDEGHGNRRAASRYDYSLRMMRWFDQYLKGDGGAPPPASVDYPLAETGADG